ATHVIIEKTGGGHHLEYKQRLRMRVEALPRCRNRATSGVCQLVQASKPQILKDFPEYRKAEWSRQEAGGRSKQTIATGHNNIIKLRI
ncbi:MAG: hypothetical protein WBA93_01315, partial [Microcoleaceae cyanobacterium]